MFNAFEWIWYGLTGSELRRVLALCDLFRTMDLNGGEFVIRCLSWIVVTDEAQPQNLRSRSSPIGEDRLWLLLVALKRASRWLLSTLTRILQLILTLERCRFGKAFSRKPSTSSIPARAPLDRVAFVIPQVLQTGASADLLSP